MIKKEAQTILNEKEEASVFSTEEVRERLKALADPKYREFHSSLLPGTENVLGVRTPDLRKLAKEIQKHDWKMFLTENDRTWYENDILQGLVIAGAKMDSQERLSRIREFLPRIENWAVCDIFCGSLKDADRYPELYWEFLQPCFRSEKPYELRFAVVMLLSHFMKKEYLERAFALLDKIHHEDYYVRMAVAWAVSVYFIHFQTETFAYLKENSLDDWTYNKALQKIVESYRVSPETKARIRAMKRKTGGRQRTGGEQNEKKTE